MVSDGVGPGHRGHEITAAAARRRTTVDPEEATHHRAPAVRPAGRERRADQCPQPPVLLAGEVQDVGVDVIREGPAGDPKNSAIRPPGNAVARDRRKN